MPRDQGWRPLRPFEAVPPEVRGRYLQLMIKLYPDGAGLHGPVLSELTILYEPDFPPGSPSGVTANPGDRQVTLRWDPVADPDVAGYLIYYGTGSGLYFGTGSDRGDSPLDVGNAAEVTIGGLENERLYYFAVVAYDSSSPPHYGDFSREVHVRPSHLRPGR